MPGVIMIVDLLFLKAEGKFEARREGGSLGSALVLLQDLGESRDSGQPTVKRDGRGNGVSTGRQGQRNDEGWINEEFSVQWSVDACSAR